MQLKFIIPHFNEENNKDLVNNTITELGRSENRHKGKKKHVKFIIIIIMMIIISAIRLILQGASQHVLTRELYFRMGNLAGAQMAIQSPADEMKTPGMNVSSAFDNTG